MKKFNIKKFVGFIISFLMVVLCFCYLISIDNRGYQQNPSISISTNQEEMPSKEIEGDSSVVNESELE